MKRGEGAGPGSPPLPLGQTGPVAWPSAACAACGATNQHGLRYCLSCGRALAPVEEPPTSQMGSIEMMRTAADASRAAMSEPDGLGLPIEPGRVIDVGPAASRPGPSQRFCPRCRGGYDPGAQFCRFCGLSLATLSLAGGAAAMLAGAPPPASVRNMPTHPLAGTMSPFDHDVPVGVAMPPHVGPVTARSGEVPMSVSQSGATMMAESRAQPPSSRPVPLLARIVLIRRDGSEGAAHTIGATMDVGRIEGQVLFPEDQYVSPRHARIVAVPREGAFFLRDLDSTNGVFMRIPFAVKGDGSADREDKTTLRGHHSEGASGPVSDQPLADQELFLVGQQVLRFEVVRQAEEAFGAASENGTLLFGTPAAPRYGRLSQRTVEGVVRDVFHVRKTETIIGRESGDIVFTDDPFLSRRHAVLRFHGGEGPKRHFTLADLGSSNGTFLRIRDEVRLRHGDHFRIGQQLLRFDIDASRTGE